MENLRAFRERTAFVWDSLPREGSFVTSEGLRAKVDSDGRLRPCFGDTVIFDLSEGEKAALAQIQCALYDACGALLAEPLDPACFHLTLHDLNSAPERARVEAAMERSEAEVRALLAELPEELARSCRVRATAAFSMVNTSAVLGFEPCAEEDCARLMALYERLQRAVPLGYPLTPHVTLAYYRPGDHGARGLRLLREALAAVNGALPPLELTLAAPVYARFSDMNRYLF